MTIPQCRDCGGSLSVSCSCHDDTPIQTTFVYPPIPIRTSDWQAVRAGYEPGDLVGWGRTEAEAVADLLEQEAERD